MSANADAHNIVIESITESLLRLMRKKPLSEIKISELCQLAGVSRVSFYRNYNSLADILVKYLTHCTDEWWKDFSTRTPEEFSRTFFPELLAQYKKHENLMLLIYQNDVSYILKDHIFLCCAVNDASDENDAYSRAALAGCLYGLIDEWIKRGMNSFPKDFHLTSAVEVPPEIMKNKEKHE